MNAGFPLPTSSVVKLVVLNGREFVQLWTQVNRAAASGGGSGEPPTLPPRQPPFVSTGIRPESASCHAGCSPLQDIEVSSREARFTLGCEDGLQVDVSTTGEVEVKVKRGIVTLVGA